MAELRPSVATLMVIASDLGITVDSEHLEAAARTHAAFRDQLTEFRRYRLPFLHPVEPAHVSQWIENGGHSPDGPHEHGRAQAE